MIERWEYKGITLLAGDYGVIDMEELEAFLGVVRTDFPGAKIIVHGFGLRVWQKYGDSEDPRLEWRDW